MRSIPKAEQDAIRQVVEAGARYGYGNLISHLKTAWAIMLVQKYQMDEESAIEAAGGPGYPFAMHLDLLEKGRWDETGAAYKKEKSCK